MSRYINADELYVDWYDSFVADDGTNHDNIPLISKGQIDDAPSIDIVRCKECKWYGRRNKARFYRGADCLRIGGIGTTTPDSFCSYGERSE